MSKNHLSFITLGTLLLAVLACGLPTAQSGGGEQAQPDLAATITAQALTIQAQQPGIQPTVANSPTPEFTPTPENTSTPEFTPTITNTPTPTIPIVTVSQTTNCRTGPGTQYDLIGGLNVGQSAEVVGKYSNGNYWIIKTSGSTGICWLWGQYATVTGNTANLPEYPVPPTPTPSLPAAPKSFSIDISCTLSSLPVIKNIVHVELSWADLATNEDGYRIYRDGTLLATLGANATSLSDDTNLPAFYIVGNPPPSLTYGVEAFNGAGTSTRKEKTVSCP
jgi:uncharacterized protein YraI